MKTQREGHSRSQSNSKKCDISGFLKKGETGNKKIEFKRFSINQGNSHQLTIDKTDSVL
jgi:hypothetical protein